MIHPATSPPWRPVGAGLLRQAFLAIVATALCLPVQALVASPTMAAYPGSNGRIAYQVEGDNGSPTHLWWANPDLSDPQQLTFGDRDEFDAAWSADGTTLVFSTDRFATAPPGEPGFRVDIMTLNVVTGELKAFVGGGDIKEQPSFSPDGSRILYAYTDPFGDLAPGLYTMRASDGGDVRQVAGMPPGHYFLQWPRYSPDGSRISFAAVNWSTFRQRGSAPFQGAIFVVNADGTGLHRLTPEGFMFNYTAEWSPDGSQLVMQTDWRPGTRPSLWTVNSDGSGLRRLTDELPIPAMQSQYFQASFAPAWAPDGSVIMFNCAPGELSFWDFCTIHPDGTGRTLVRSTPEFEHRPTWQPVS